MISNLPTIKFYPKTTYEPLTHFVSLILNVVFDYSVFIKMKDNEITETGRCGKINEDLWSLQNNNHFHSCSQSCHHANRVNKQKHAIKHLPFNLLPDSRNKWNETSKENIELSIS